MENIVNKPLDAGNNAANNVQLAADNREDDPAAVIDDGFAQLLGGHTIGPLV